MKSWLVTAAALSILGFGLRVAGAVTQPVPPVEPIQVSITATDSIAAESGPSTGLFTVHRTGPTTSPLTVMYHVTGSAVAPGDYPALPGSIGIPTGSAVATILITPVDDTIAEEDETVILTLVSPIQPLTPGQIFITSGAEPLLYNIGKPASAIVTIKDNDLDNAPLPTVNIRAVDPTAAEPTNPGKITISRLGNVQNALQVFFDIVKDPIPMQLPSNTAASSADSPTVLVPAATPGVDYEALPASITLPPGVKSISLTIQPIDDLLIEGREHVTLRLKPDALYSINQPDAATVVINDDDPVNIPPIVSLVAPAEGASFVAPSLITLRAEATDKDGTIQKVDFLSGDKMIGTVTAPASDGYLFAWNDVPAGKYTLRARATDQKGKSTTSNPIHVVVTKDVNLPPSVAITSPTTGQSFTAPASIPVAAQAVDKDGSVLTVEFFANGKSIGITKGNPMSASPVNPFQIAWNDVAAGEYVLTAKATDNLGAATTSAPVKIKVLALNVPVVTIQARQPQVLESDPARPGLFAVTRTGSVQTKLDVLYLVSGTAENGGDYSKLPGVVTIPAGEASATISVVPVPDKALEGKETVTVTLTQLIFVQPPAVLPPGLESNYLVGSPRTATVTIYEAPDQSTTGTRLVPAGATWNYLDTGTDQAATWRTPGFDESTWKSGPAQLGYGDGDEATVVSFGPDPQQKFITTYFRNTFQVQDTTTVASLLVRLLCDDGAVVYLNGTEVFRSNMPEGTVTFKSLATTSISGAAESTWRLAKADPKLLVKGANVVAVEVHQAAVTSSDISFDLELLANPDGSEIPPAATLVINSPKDGAIFNEPANITINATAIDPKGYITRVEFFANDQSIGVSEITFIRAPDPGTPIQHNLEWKNPAVGKYTVVAKAKYSAGAILTSPAVTIAILSAPTPVQRMSLSNGRTFAFHGEAGRLYSIQTSTDLLHWNEVGTVESTDGTFQYADSADDSVTQRFYRAVPLD